MRDFSEELLMAGESGESQSASSILALGPPAAAGSLGPSPCPSSGRPLSIASTSSTSTTSSAGSSSVATSLGFHGRHPGQHHSSSYLASAESLQDGSICLSGGATISDDEGEGTAGAGDRLLRYTDNVVHELLETERAYIHDLAAVIQGYLRPMRECGVRDGFINEKDLPVLFGNLDEILKFNSQFLERLTSECSRRLLSGERPGSHAIAVAECFLLHFAPSEQLESENSTSEDQPTQRDPAATTGGLKVYAHYCTNYPRSLQVLSRLVQPESRSCALLAKLQLGLGHRMQLGSYLLKPVQRILKYPLLLDAMRHYEKDYPGWPGQELIEKALKAMQRIANRINEIKKLDEDAVRVQEVQSVLQGWTGNDLTTYGGLVAEERVMCQKKHLMHIFLFEKMLLITKRKRKAPNLLWYTQHIFTNDLMVNENRVIVGDCSFQVLSKSNRAITFVFETTGRERKKLWCDRLNKIILDSLNISPEQRSKILENLRIQRNLSKQQQQQQQQSKMQKKASRGFDSLKKATHILHRNRRSSMDNNNNGLQRDQEQKTTTSAPTAAPTAEKQEMKTQPPQRQTSLDLSLLASSHRPRKTHGSNTQESHEGRVRHGGSVSLKSWSAPKDGLSSRLLRHDHHNQQRKYHSQLDLREVSADGPGRSSMGSLQRSSSLPRWVDSDPLSALRLRSHSLGKGGPGLGDHSRGRQWRHMLFTLGSRLRTSLMSSDSACSSTTQSTADRHEGGSLRPASMDSALFHGANSDESEVDEEEELESNNSSGSFYERNFEMSCRDEIFRDSAVFSEDAISQLSTEIAACHRDRNTLSVRRGDDSVPSQSSGLTLASIERTESGFAEGYDEDDQKATEKSRKEK